MAGNSCEATRAELVAFCKGEVSLDERAAITMHLEVCATCRDELVSFEALFRLARSVPRIEVSPDARLSLRDRIRAARTRSWMQPLRRAAGVLGLLLVIALVAALFFERARRPERATVGEVTTSVAALAEPNPWQAVERALAWLAGEQDPKVGCWWPERSGGRGSARVGVSALALLAFANATESQRARYRDVIDRAAQFLERSADTEFVIGEVPGDESLSRFNHATAVLALSQWDRLRGGAGITHNAVLTLASLCAHVDGRPSSYDEAFMMLAMGAVQSVPAQPPIEPEHLTLIAWTGAQPSERYDASLFEPTRRPDRPERPSVAGAPAGDTFGLVLQMLEQPSQREPAFVFFATKLVRERGGQDWLRYRELLLDRFARNQTAGGAWSLWQQPTCLPGGVVYTTAMNVLSLHLCLGAG